MIYLSTAIGLKPGGRLWMLWKHQQIFFKNSYISDPFSMH